MTFSFELGRPSLHFVKNHVTVTEMLKEARSRQ
jgi:hypothetical protein